MIQNENIMKEYYENENENKNKNENENIMKEYYRSILVFCPLCLGD